MNQIILIRKKNKFAWELWEYDKKKVELIESYDYNLEIVWESDFNEKTTLQKIIKKYDKKNQSISNT